MYLKVIILILATIKNGITKPLKNSSDVTQVPESLLMKLDEIQDASQFMSLFITSEVIQQSSYSPSEVFHAYLEADGGKESKTISTMSGNDTTVIPVASHAACIPENQTIRFPRPSEPSEINWPQCTRVRRCGGCCTSNLLKCSPTSTSTVSIRLIRARYSKPSSKKFDLLGYKVIELVQHDKCRCVCRENARDCTTLQTYSPEECRCICKNAASASNCKGQDRHWDRRECSCKCNHYEDCSTGFFFNPLSCRCESLHDPLRGISNSEMLGRKYRPFYKDDGGENDEYRSRQIGIRPVEDTASSFKMARVQRDKIRIRVNQSDNEN